MRPFTGSDRLRKFSLGVGVVAVVAASPAETTAQGLAQVVAQAPLVPGELAVEDLAVARVFAPVGRKAGSWVIFGQARSAAAATDNARPARARRRPAAGAVTSGRLTAFRLEGRHQFGAKLSLADYRYPTVALRNKLVARGRAVGRVMLSARQDLFVETILSHDAADVADLPEDAERSLESFSFKQTVFHRYRHAPYQITTQLGSTSQNFTQVPPKTRLNYKGRERTRLDFAGTAGYSWRRGYRAFGLAVVKRPNVTGNARTDVELGVGLVTNIPALTSGEVSLRLARSFGIDRVNPRVVLQGDLKYKPHPLLLLRTTGRLTAQNPTTSQGVTEQRLTLQLTYRLYSDLTLKSQSKVRLRQRSSGITGRVQQQGSVSYRLSRGWQASLEGSYKIGRGRETRQRYRELSARVSVARNL